MFFSTYVLTKKGPLAKIWLAAHWDKKLTKNEVKVIDLKQSVVQIVDPVVPIALRTSGELMVGVVRIYSLKVRHLLKDATDATMLLLRPKNVQLVKGKEKENAAAVTMDIVVARAAGTDVAEADFGGIADILAGKPVSGAVAGKAAAGEDVIGTAWFTTESSQFIEDGALGASQDEIAKIRADLLNQGAAAARADSSTTGTSKTSMSSMEKGRMSNQVAAGVAADDLLDIGLPPPADMEFVMPAMDGDLGQLPMADLADPFAAPDALASQPKDGSKLGVTADGEDALPTKMARKLPKLLDANDTVMSKEQFKRMVNDTHDIVNAERRHGPLDDEEARDRHTIRAGESNIVDCQPLSDVVAPGLKAVFEAALRTSVAKAVERMEAARGSTSETARASGRAAEFVADDIANLPEAEMPAPDALGDFPANLPQEEGEEIEGSRANKRKRGEQRDGFSASAIATLERVRGVLKGRTEKMTFNGIPAKGETFKRQAAARTFVDVLALASHGFVDVEQSRPFADIAILKTQKLNDPIVAAN